MMIVKIPKNLYQIQTQDFSICNTGLSFGPFKPKTLKHVAHKFAELFYFHQTALLTPKFVALRCQPDIPSYSGIESGNW